MASAIPIIIKSLFASFWWIHVILRRKIYDEYNDEEVELTKEEIRLVQRLLKGKAPHTDFDQYVVCSFHEFLCLLIFQVRWPHISLSKQ